MNSDRAVIPTSLVGVVAAVAVIWLLRAAAIVAIPLAAAFFITLVVYPFQVWVSERLPRHRWAAIALTMIAIVIVVGGAIWAAAESLDEAAEAAPRYGGRLRTLWSSVEESARAAGFPLPENVLGSADVQRRLQDLAASALRATWELASGLVLVFFLVLLMLLEAPVWTENTRRVLREDRGDTAVATVTGIADKVRRYLYVRTILGLMSAAAAGLWLIVLDVDLVLVWVVLTFALNYIPNLGSIIAVIPPSLMALVQHGPVIGVVALGGLTVLEQVIGNFIDPRMQGRRLHISPVVVLVALVFWTWLWGPAGALLAVPMTVALLSAAARVRPLAGVATLFAAETEAPRSRSPSKPDRAA